MLPTSSWSKDIGTPQSVFLEQGRALIAYLLRQRKNVQSIAPDGRLVILARALRTFGYGFTSVLLGVMLTRAGLPAVSIGLLLAVAALGSITFSLVMGMFADRLGRRRSLMVSALLMMGTGFAFAFTRYYPLLLLAAFCGTISPSTNDNTPFSGIEQSVLAQASPPRRHPMIFAFYNLTAQLAGALGGLAVALPEVLSHVGIATGISMRSLFVLYGVLAGSTALLFLQLSPAAEVQPAQEKTTTAAASVDDSRPATLSSGQKLEKTKTAAAPPTEAAATAEGSSTQQLHATRTRRLVLRKPRIQSRILKLTGLFAVDAFAGGLAVQTMLAVWFSHRFGASLASLGLLFFGVNLLAALSFVAAPRLSRRFGLLKTMLVPHFVSNLFLLSVPFMPTFPLAATFLLLRQSLSKLDVPARQAYTMALVSPEERTAAASYTTVARSIAVSASPPIAGIMLSGPMLVLGLPILLASCIGVGYDATMWRVFRHVPLHPSHKRVVYPLLRVGKGGGRKQKNKAEDLESDTVGENESSQPPGRFSTMSIQFSQGKLKGKDRKQVLEEVQKQVQEAALLRIRLVLEAFLEAEVTAKLGREKGQLRRVSGQVREIDWQCGHCGCRDANQFTRDGHYKRTLDTGWGEVRGLKVPRLECQHCGHNVICRFTILEKYRRFWLDLDQDVLFGSGLCQRLRQLSQRWSAIAGGSVGLRTLNERLNQIEPPLAQVHSTPITNVPPVVQWDAIWVTIQSQQPTIKQDRRLRRRHRHSGKRVVVLVALGSWPDGRREVLDWELAGNGEQPAWQTLVHRLWERGLTPEQGLRMVVRDGSGGLGEALAFVYGTRVLEQRYLFHNLRNVADESGEDLPGKEHRETRQQLIEQASAIYQAKSAVQARQGFLTWAAQWRERSPKAVATLEREFEQTIVYYALKEVPREWIRTTCLLERTNRELRRKLRQAKTFGSQKGMEVAIYLQVQRLHARWSKQQPTWWDTSHSL